MRLRIAADGTAALEEPLDFRRFSILRDAAAPAVAGIRLDGEHGWVDPATLRRLSPLVGDPAWEAGMTGMLAFAAGKGWVDGTGAVRAHLAAGHDGVPVGA